MTTTVSLPYGDAYLPVTIPSARLRAVLRGRLSDYRPEQSQEQLAKNALAQPIGSPPLWELARDKKRVVILSSDHTRPVPSRILMPLLLEEIRRGNPQAQITILIATGCHRASTRAEQIARYGEKIVREERIEVHDCGCAEQLADLGVLPSGNRLLLNKTAAQADLLIADGFIEPHFFAGFSGGRKAVLPGVAGRESIFYNHCAQNIKANTARAGCLTKNPIHEDMCAAAKRAGLAFILNVVLNGQKEIAGAFAGHPEQAHAAGVAFLQSLSQCAPAPAEIVIATNGGAPLDQNIYQSVKGMYTAAQTCLPGGIIIMVSRCEDGHGGADFYRDFSRNADHPLLLREIMSRAPLQTCPDQWQSQIFLEVLAKHPVYFVSDAPPEMVKALHLVWQPSVQAALEAAFAACGEKAGLTVIPDAVSTYL